MPAMRTVLALAVLCSLLASCSSQDLYRVGQDWQKQECQKLRDLDERKRCEQSAAASYDRYKAEAEAAKAPKPQ
jgi:hypothetical protein